MFFKKCKYLYITNGILYYSKIDLGENCSSNISLEKTFVFEKKLLVLYSKKGNLLFSDPDLKDNKSNSIHNNYTTIINNIVSKINKIKKIKNRNGAININIFFMHNTDKIVFVDIEEINIISIGVFSIKTKTIIIKFYLLNFLITFINYLHERENIIFNTNINNNIYIDIYKSFLFLPFEKYFEFLSRKIFKRQKLKFKNIFYKNYYLVELDSEKIIFSFQSLYNKNINNGEGGSKYQLKIHKKEQIWNEILYHSHKLRKLYIDKYSLNFIEEHYQNYYVFVELKSTFPRRTFLIKFLPVLNGLALIHEYVQIKLSSIKGDEKIYKECESLYGFIDDIKSQNEKINNNNQLILLKDEPIILKKVNLFFVKSLFVNFPSKELFNWRNKKNIYISQEIMNIIDRHLISMNNYNNYNILKNIEKDLYKEYLEMIQTENKESEINSSNKLIRHCLSDNDDINDNDISYNERVLYNNNNYHEKLLLNIPKKFILTTLFDKINYNNKNGNNINIKNIYTEKIKNILYDNYNHNHSNRKKNYSNSKKEINKLSDILNDNISEFTGTSNIYSQNKNDDNNNNNIYNNSFKNNIFDSNILFENRENSLMKEDYFNIDISIIEKEEKKHRKNHFFKYNNNNELKNDKIRKFSFESTYNKSKKKQDSYHNGNSDIDYLQSKEEFLEGEIRNKVK